MMTLNSDRGPEPTPEMTRQIEEAIRQWFPVLRASDLSWTSDGTAEVFTITSVEVGEGVVTIGGRYQILGDGEFGPEVLSEDEMAFQVPFSAGDLGDGDLADPDFWAEEIEGRVRVDYPRRLVLPVEALEDLRVLARGQDSGGAAAPAGGVMSQWRTV